MARDASHETDDPVDEQYRPMYEYDPDAGFGTTGEVVRQVPREDQIEALRSIAGDGPTEPDGWVRGYNETLCPVIDGVPVLLIDSTSPFKTKSQGVEKIRYYAVDDSLGPVRVDSSGGHPENVSKVAVEEKAQ